ncbi:MAG: glycosyl transferase [Planctomycetes bacterium]|jgi:glycosyltransferase involved in cell wall biosynthesis|nr:glycosyl transferase [Planctomycetota bacterium]MDP6410292.1 glycosyltransferase family A protein [Planctomycetota bacterium]
MEPPPTLTAVMPVCDGRAHLERSLPALIEAGRGLLAEVIVVDDGSVDDSGAYAASLGARVLRLGDEAQGPARARNRGAASATGEVVLFVDADVVVHRDAVERVARALVSGGPAAVFGTYDAQPAARNLASLYVNLRHHHVHRRPSEDAATFWSGLGAVRREAFEEVGGYDAERFSQPSIEDIDLGRRLREAGGRIRRDPTLRGKHLKVWSWRSVVRTDFFLRALPWARLMGEHPGAFDDLNVGRSERARALLALAWLTSLLAAVCGATDAPVLLLVGAAVFAANGPLVLTFLRGGGPLLAVAGTLFHQVYFLYSAAAYLYCRITGPPAAGRDRARRSP